jgi:hypothetical protein
LQCRRCSSSLTLLRNGKKRVRGVAGHFKRLTSNNDTPELVQPPLSDSSSHAATKRSTAARRQKCAGPDARSDSAAAAGLKNGLHKAVCTVDTFDNSCHCRRRLGRTIIIVASTHRFSVDHWTMVHARSTFSQVQLPAIVAMILLAIRLASVDRVFNVFLLLIQIAKSS